MWRIHHFTPKIPMFVLGIGCGFLGLNLAVAGAVSRSTPQVLAGTVIFLAGIYMGLWLAWNQALARQHQKTELRLVTRPVPAPSVCELLWVPGLLMMFFGLSTIIYSMADESRAWIGAGICAIGIMLAEYADIRIDIRKRAQHEEA